MRKLYFVFTVFLLLGTGGNVLGETTEDARRILYPRKPFFHYQIIIERNLFKPQGEVVSWIHPAKVSTKIPLANLYLTGIVYDGKKILAIIENRLRKSEGFFAEGELIGEAKLVEIKEKEQLVILEYRGDEIMLSLSPLEKPKKSLPPPASLSFLPSESDKPAKPIKTRASLFPIRERLGIHAREISPELSKRLRLPIDAGLYILVVNKNSPAGFARVSGGDILAEINGRAVSTIQEAQATMENVSVGSEVSLGIIKKGKKELEATTVRILKE